MSRDLDSRISEREAAAVKEWLASGDVIHSMRRVLIACMNTHRIFWIILKRIL